MEPTAIATAIATLLFSEALKEGGKSLGQEVSKIASQLIVTVRNRFKTSGSEGVLARAEEKPTESNINRVKHEMIAQMEEDEEFTNQLRELLAQSEASAIVYQVVGEGIEVGGNLSLDAVTQKASEGSFIKQGILEGGKIQGNVEIGNLTQSS
ncbi:hypothetical protein [Phormidesmis priestleyi]